jgi:hypothetical protein
VLVTSTVTSDYPAAMRPVIQTTWQTAHNRLATIISLHLLRSG